MVVSVSGGSPRFLMSASMSDIIFLKVLKSYSPFFTDCMQARVRSLIKSYLKEQQPIPHLHLHLNAGHRGCLAAVSPMHAAARLRLLMQRNIHDLMLLRSSATR